MFNKLSWLILAFMTGIALGIFFFASLWWATKQLILQKRSLMLWIGTLLLRFTVLLSGVYLISDHHWQRMLACLSGFVAVRIVIKIKTWIKKTG